MNTTDHNNPINNQISISKKKTKQTNKQEIQQQYNRIFFELLSYRHLIEVTW